MKKLFLITTGFPYPAKSMETYLETEVQYYKDFDEVNIISLGVRRSVVDEKRNINSISNCCVIPVIFASKIEYILNGFTALFDSNFYKELYELYKKKMLTVRRIIRLLIYVSRSHVDARKIVKTMKLEKKNPISDAVIYSYRFEYQPYVALLLKKYFKRPWMIARAHGYDLYEERNNDQYIPARRILLENFDKVYLISNDGYDYLRQKYPQYKEKMNLSRLGVTDNGIKGCLNSEKTFRIVSCSNMVKLKRIDRIIVSLAKLKSENVAWVHFGTGEEEERLREMAEEMLGDKIEFEFKGQVANDVVIRYYKENSVHLFINLSEYEGIPVSIMEAMSFGIPCVATNVGGTAEIVEDGFNGRLINSENEEFIAGILDSFVGMDINKYKQFRVSARSTWENKYNAQTNYGVFVKDIIGLLGNESNNH